MALLDFISVAFWMAWLYKLKRQGWRNGNRSFMTNRLPQSEAISGL